MRRGLALGVMLLAGLAVPGPAHAQQRLVTIETPSKFVNAATANFRPEDPRVLRANVLLPDGYTRKKRYPLLLLLHGAGERWDSWARPDRGDIMNTAKGLDAIVVMPNAANGFYTNWWNGGRRGDPAWERYFFDELIPLIERRYPIRAGRRWHAIVGFSMAGYGTAFLASQRPGYFGTAAPLSGFVSLQRPENDIGLSIFSGVDYDALFGPVNGFYAAGHNPVALAPNLQHTRMWISTGNGIPRPGYEADLTDLLSGTLEAFLRDQNAEFAAALRRVGASVKYTEHLGNHSFPYWREDLRNLIKDGLFGAVQSTPPKWSYSTVAQESEAWGLRFAFARPPETVVTFRREGAELVAAGAGRVTVRDTRECQFTAELPFRRLLSGRLCRRLRVKLAPASVPAGVRRRVRVAVTTVEGGRRVPASGARVTLGRRARLADSRGRTSFVVTGTRDRPLRVRATRAGSRGASARLRVR